MLLCVFLYIFLDVFLFFAYIFRFWDFPNENVSLMGKI